MTRVLRAVPTSHVPRAVSERQARTVGGAANAYGGRGRKRVRWAGTDVASYLAYDVRERRRQAPTVQRVTDLVGGVRRSVYALGALFIGCAVASGVIGSSIATLLDARAAVVQLGGTSAEPDVKGYGFSGMRGCAQSGIV